MNRDNELLKIVIYILLSIFFTIYAINFNNKIPKPVYDYRVPPPPDKRYHDKYWRWDSESKQWILNPYYIDLNKDTRVKEFNGEKTQKFLEKKVDGYMEDTYWGEEYDLNDKEN